MGRDPVVYLENLLKIARSVTLSMFRRRSSLWEPSSAAGTAKDRSGQELSAPRCRDIAADKRATYEELYTIAGARKRLSRMRENGKSKNGEPDAVKAENA